MPTHADLLNNMVLLRAALIQRYKWFIHETPDVKIPDIREVGLRANRDAAAPAEVKEFFGANEVPILCLHPLGAKLCPPAAHATLEEPKIGQRISFASLAVKACDLPQRLGLDWSYAWNILETTILENTEIPLPELVALAAQLVNEYGSVAAYDTIDPKKIRVLCRGQPPTNPRGWSMLTDAGDENMVRHVKIPLP
jgi:hypothetical protein